MTQRGARYLDVRRGLWTQTDPALGEYISTAGTQADKLPGMGGVYNLVNAQLYHYAGNNPVKYTDPDGRDIIVLNRSYGASGFGHNAILIGNDKDGWTYFSKDGSNPVNGRNNPETGKPATPKDSLENQDNINKNNEKTKYVTLNEFIKANKNRDKDDQYDRGLFISTTSEEDKKLIEKGEKFYQNPYSLREGDKGQNCGDLVGDIVTKSDTSAKGNKKGLLGFTMPNKQYEQFKKDNPCSKEINVLRINDDK